MLRSINEIIGYRLMATDGVIGKCMDFLFEDRPWVVRYLVARANDALFGRKVLLSLVALEQPDWATGLLHVSLTRRQIENSPPLREDEPVSREYEKQSFLYYGWPAYWEHSIPKEPAQESFLRSVNEVTGYTVMGTDKRVGKIKDMIVDDEIWAIRYLAVETDRVFGEKMILLAPQWVYSVDWLNQAVNVGLADDIVRNSPDYNPREPINRDYETALHDYHGRPYYWDIDSTV
jgi:hypothetical protein